MPQYSFKKEMIFASDMTLTASISLLLNDGLNQGWQLMEHMKLLIFFPLDFTT